MTEQELSLIYGNTVDDGTWKLEVFRLDDHTGKLAVTEVRTGTVVHTQVVGLSYGAVFGPDVADVDDWQKITIDVIDNPEKRQVQK